MEGNPLDELLLWAFLLGSYSFLCSAQPALTPPAQPTPPLSHICLGLLPQRAFIATIPPLRPHIHTCPYTCLHMFPNVTRLYRYMHLTDMHAQVRLCLQTHMHACTSAQTCIGTCAFPTMQHPCLGRWGPQGPVLAGEPLLDLGCGLP